MTEALAWKLNPQEARVLGALLEKDFATPEYYPLSLHALQAACNQKSSREPVMELSEDEIRLALRNLSEKGLVESVRGERVPKFRHQLQEKFNLPRPQTALICLLLLRGAQTPGELRGRSARLHPFTDLDAVTAALNQLASRQPALAAALPRGAGEKETRWMELLQPPIEGAARALPEPKESLTDRIERLEHEVAELKAEVAAFAAKPN